jgi:hypothetical protein
VVGRQNFVANVVWQEAYTANQHTYCPLVQAAEPAAAPRVVDQRSHGQRRASHELLDDARGDPPTPLVLRAGSGEVEQWFRAKPSSYSG